MIFQRHFALPLTPPLLPLEQPVCSNTWETGEVMVQEGKKKMIQHPTLGLLVAPLNQWIFYKLSPEVHKHWERERERLSERQRWTWGGWRESHLGVLARCFLILSTHGHLLRWIYRDIAALGAVNKAASLSVFLCLELTLPTIWPCVMITINAWIACIKNVEWKRVPPLPLVASFYWRGQGMWEEPSVPPG